jgi:hypothetical protein
LLTVPVTSAYFIICDFLLMELIFTEILSKLWSKHRASYPYTTSFILDFSLPQLPLIARKIANCFHFHKPWRGMSFIISVLDRPLFILHGIAQVEWHHFTETDKSGVTLPYFCSTTLKKSVNCLQASILICRFRV